MWLKDTTNLGWHVSWKSKGTPGTMPQLPNSSCKDVVFNQAVFTSTQKLVQKKCLLLMDKIQHLSMSFYRCPWFISLGLADSCLFRWSIFPIFPVTLSSSKSAIQGSADIGIWLFSFELFSPLPLSMALGTSVFFNLFHLKKKWHFYHLYPGKSWKKGQSFHLVILPSVCRCWPVFVVKRFGRCETMANPNLNLNLWISCCFIRIPNPPILFNRSWAVFLGQHCRGILQQVSLKVSIFGW